MSDQDRFSLPLFPLNTVLYPGLLLPLHIFEERYRVMINKCLDQEKPFGVVLISKGVEAHGEPATPCRVGTMARIVKSEEQKDGRIEIVTVGGARFKIWDYSTSADGYLVGEVSILPEETSDPLLYTQEVEQANLLLKDYIDLLVTLNDSKEEISIESKLAKEPNKLTYQIASIVKMPLPEQQKLLELSNTKSRLDFGIDIMHRTISLLQEVLEERKVVQTQDLPWGGQVNLN